MKRTSLMALMILAGCGGNAANPAADAMLDAAAPDFATCTGACMTTAVMVNISAQRMLDVAYYGVNQSGTLHVEVYANAAAGCPTMSSPTPDYALILGSVPVPTDTSSSTSSANLLDYKGDLLGGPLGKAATTVALVPTSFAVATHLALDLDLGFSPGTAMGHVFAIHCTSLDN
ncbi:hypothetical protein BH11MYX1_BH11MYX1_50400 [soil metagenome]